MDRPQAVKTNANKFANIRQMFANSSLFAPEFSENVWLTLEVVLSKQTMRTNGGLHRGFPMRLNSVSMERCSLRMFACVK